MRTSGEQRLSNFLLWEAAYAELVYQNVLWPDYGHEALADAVRQYRSGTGVSERSRSSRALAAG